MGTGSQFLKTLSGPPSKLKAPLKGYVLHQKRKFRAISKRLLTRFWTLIQKHGPPENNCIAKDKIKTWKDLAEIPSAFRVLEFIDPFFCNFDLTSCWVDHPGLSTEILCSGNPSVPGI